jgi:hypothetical protein
MSLFLFLWSLTFAGKYNNQVQRGWVQPSAKAFSCCLAMMVESDSVMAHLCTNVGKWRGKSRMEWEAHNHQTNADQSHSSTYTTSWCTNLKFPTADRTMSTCQNAWTCGDYPTACNSALERSPVHSHITSRDWSAELLVSANHSTLSIHAAPEPITARAL